MIFAQGWIDFQKTALRIHQSHSDRRAGERRLQTRLTRAQRLLGAPGLRDVARSFPPCPWPRTVGMKDHLRLHPHPAFGTVRADDAMLQMIGRPLPRGLCDGCLDGFAVVRVNGLLRKDATEASTSPGATPKIRNTSSDQRDWLFRMLSGSKNSTAQLPRCAMRWARARSASLSRSSASMRLPFGDVLYRDAQPHDLAFIFDHVIAHRPLAWRVRVRAGGAVEFQALLAALACFDGLAVHRLQHIGHGRQDLA